MLEIGKAGGAIVNVGLGSSYTSADNEVVMNGTVKFGRN